MLNHCKRSQAKLVLILICLNELYKEESEPSFNDYSYEKSIEVSLIDASACFGSILCFKYLLLNGYNLGSSSIGCAIHGGKAEIIHIVEQNGFHVSGKDIVLCLHNHQRDVFDWILEKFPDSLTVDIVMLCFEVDFTHAILKYKGQIELTNLINFDLIPFMP